MVPVDAFRVTKDKSGGYAVESKNLFLQCDRVSFDISELPNLELGFSETQKSQGKIGSVQGTIEKDLGVSNGVKITRELFTSNDHKYMAVRFGVRNTREKCIRLNAVSPLEIAQKDSLVVSDSGLDRWRVLRFPEQKNEVASCYRPWKVDEDFEDAVFTSEKAVAGRGIEHNAVDMSQTRITSSPALVIKNDANNARPGVIFTILGQTNHLTEMALTSNKARNELESLEVKCLFDGIAVDPEDQMWTHWLMVFNGKDEGGMLRHYADILADEFGIKQPPRPPLVLYCSWYFYVKDFREENLEEELRTIKEKSISIDAFVIDNGWMDDFGNYEPNWRFPKGMKYAADLIKAQGIQPGIWTVPNIIAKSCPMLKKYPEIWAHDTKGEPVSYKNADHDCYVVDPTAPGVQELYNETYAKLKGWGYTYHKLDYLRAIVLQKDMKFKDPKVNRAMAYRMVLQQVHNALGHECYIAGCGGVYDAANLGLFNAYRTSRDVRGQWEGVRKKRTLSAIIQIKQNVLRNYTNRFWHTDPDATMIRLRSKPFRDDESIRNGVYLSEGHYTDEEAFSIMVNQYLGGGNITITERFPELQQSRLDLYRHICPVAAPPARIADYQTVGCPSLFVTDITPKCADLGIWWNVTVSNWQDNTATRELKIGKLSLPSSAEQFAVFEFKNQEFLGIKGKSDIVALVVPAHGTRVLRMVPWDGKKPVLVGTDLHLTGGACEIVEGNFADDSFTGRIETKWKYPVKVTVGFPDANNRALVVSATVAVGQQEFTITKP